MNGRGPSSIPIGNKFGQQMVDQRPKYEHRKMFRKRLRRGRPRKCDKPQCWVT